MKLCFCCQFAILLKQKHCQCKLSQVCAPHSNMHVTSGIQLKSQLRRWSSLSSGPEVKSPAAAAPVVIFPKEDVYEFKLSFNVMITVREVKTSLPRRVFLTCELAFETQTEMGGAPACERVTHVGSSLRKFRTSPYSSTSIPQNKDFMQLKGNALQS